MQQLQGLDASFLFLESVAMPMHTGTLQLYALPPGPRGRFLTLLREHVKERLPELPVLCRRLWWMPLNLANPAWIPARPDLRVHIVAAKLARGAGLPELEAELARLHAALLDRERPLWQIHVFEDIAPGADGQRRAALFLRLHLAGFDAEATLALANALMDLSAAVRRAGARRTRKAAPFESGMGETLRAVIGGQAGKTAAIIRDMPATLAGLRTVAGRALAQAGLLGGGKGGGIGLAPPTPFNLTLAPGRCFGTLTLAQAEVEDLAQRHGASREELLLLLCAGALRRHLARHGPLPRRSLVAAVPAATTRGKGGKGAGRLPAMRLIGLGTHLADPLRRLAYIRASAGATRAREGAAGGAALPTDFPSLGLPWLLEAASRLYGRVRVAERMPLLANLVVGFVPGPAQPLYLAGAQLLASYPASVLVHGLGLNITVRSQAGALDVGIVADARALPDARALAHAFAAAWDDLSMLPTPGPRGAGRGPARALARQAERAGKAVGDAMQSAVQDAVQGAVQGAVRAAAAGASAGLARGVGGLARRAVRAAIGEGTTASGRRR
jgi:WS/DGAT/MGAT family acyltransferase